TVEDLVEIVRLVTDAVVGDPILGEVVGADAFAAVHRADLAGTIGRRVGQCLLLGHRLQPSGQHLQGSRLVLQLRAFVLACDDNSGGQVGNSYRRVGGVDALTTLAGRSVDVDAQVRLVDLYFADFLGFRVDQHAGGRSMHAALGFGDRNALYPVHSTLELHPRPHTVGRVAFAGDRQRRVLVTTEIRGGFVQYGYRPAV